MARSFFEDAGRDVRSSLAPFARVGFACESLKVTTRIMHIVAWLLTQRAIESGEIPDRDGRRPERRLGHAQDSDQAVVVQLPESAQKLINASSDLYARVKRLDYSKAHSMTGVKAILTDEDLPKPAAGGTLGEGVQATVQSERGLTMEPLYQGDPILAVAAVDEKTAS